MKVRYIQGNRMTTANVGASMIGLARVRPGDKWNPRVGLAVAMIKAELGPLTNSRELEELRAYHKAKGVLGVSGWTHFDMPDVAAEIWVDQRTRYNIALKEVRRKREAATASRPYLPVGPFMLEQIGRPIQHTNGIPSDGQLAENFAKSLLQAFHNLGWEFPAE